MSFGMKVVVCLGAVAGLLLEVGKWYLIHQFFFG